MPYISLAGIGLGRQKIYLFLAVPTTLLTLHDVAELIKPVVSNHEYRVRDEETPNQLKTRKIFTSQVNEDLKGPIANIHRASQLNFATLTQPEFVTWDCGFSQVTGDLKISSAQ